MMTRRRVAPVSALVVLLAVTACSGSDDAPVGSEPTVVVEPTTPDPVPSGDTRAPLTAAPACAAPGSRVVLRLGWTSDRRIPSCLRLEDFRVRFGGEKAVITRAGLTSEGFCALDVVVPKSASSGPVRVLTEEDTYETDAEFPVPCP
jgi:hypothetical protein